MDTVVRAVSAPVLPVWVDFTGLKGLPCAPGPATTRRGMLVTNGRAGVQVRAVVRVVRPLDRTNYSVQRAIPNPSLALTTQSTLYTHSSVSSVLLARRRTVVVVYILLQLRLLLYHINYILQCDIGNNIIQHGNVRTPLILI